VKNNLVAVAVARESYVSGHMFSSANYSAHA
jgi:hypothetical protein